MAEAPNSPVNVVEETGRKRTASEVGYEAEGSPDPKKTVLENDPLEELLKLGEYPYNIKRTCVLHDHSGDAADPEGLTCQQFESEFGEYNADLFIDQNEAEDLLATLETLGGKLANETQPLSLEYAPNNPPPLPLQYEYPPMLGWTSEDFKTEGEADQTTEKRSN